MGFPKKIKKYLPLIEQKTLLARRHEMADMISEDGTYLPKSLLHADMDAGFLEFVRDQLELSVEGKKIPMVDVLITTQNWAQFTETWDFENIDKNAEPPFITVIRTPEVKYGNNPSIVYNIPNRRLYFYMQVPTWDGQRHGMDIYKIPQPIPVDIEYTVAIICNRMREINKFNQVIMTKFASLQAYQVIKGHYIPIKITNISDESVLELEKRKYYIQKYTFTLGGFLLDEDEFEVVPAITRVLQMYEVDTKSKKRKQRKAQPPPSPTITYDYASGSTSLSTSKTFDYRVDLNFIDSLNVSSYDVFINGLLFGTDIRSIPVNTGDVIDIVIIKQVPNDESWIQWYLEYL